MRGVLNLCSTCEKEEKNDINTIIPLDPDIYQGVMIIF